MASSINGPLVSAGPSINGIETTLELYEPDQLALYLHWPQLLLMVNKTFQLNHVEFWPANLSVDRFKKPQEFIDELEPEFFTFILTSKETEAGQAPKIYATASARTMLAHTASGNTDASSFHGEARHKPGETEAWELKILAVDSALYKKGVGSILMDLVEVEIKKRVKLKKLSKPDTVTCSEEETADSVKPLEITYTLTTLAEVNEQFYLRKGYKRIKLVPLPLGTFGVIKQCHVTHMEKVITT